MLNISYLMLAIFFDNLFYKLLYILKITIQLALGLKLIHYNK